VDKIRRDRTRSGSKPRAAELDLFQSIHDLVKIKDEMGAIGDEEAASAVKTYKALSDTISFKKYRGGP
jgi:hypothetical protein